MTYQGVLFDHQKVMSELSSWYKHGEQTESTPSAYELMHVLTVSLSNLLYRGMVSHGNREGCSSVCCWAEPLPSCLFLLSS